MRLWWTSACHRWSMEHVTKHENEEKRWKIHGQVFLNVWQQCTHRKSKCFYHFLLMKDQWDKIFRQIWHPNSCQRHPKFWHISELVSLRSAEQWQRKMLHWSFATNFERIPTATHEDLPESSFCISFPRIALAMEIQQHRDFTVT